jgi:signal transduction histidine kinase
MSSVRTRITVIAAVTTAVAVSVAGFFLLSQLSSSLDREINESLERQLFNFENEITTYADFETVPVPNDPETLLIVLDSDGFAPLTNDGGVSGVEVAEALPLASHVSNQVEFADISLNSPTETTEPGSLRAAYLEMFLEDQQIGEEFFAVVARSSAPADRTVAGLRNALMIGLPLLVAFVAGLAWWLTGRSLDPVEQMRLEVDEISSTDLARRVSEPATTDEIGQLARTMNRMLARLEQSQQTQEQFVSDAAHELRTPLASIAAQIDVDHAHPASADREATASNVRLEVTRLQSLIDGLLTSARNQAPQAPIHQSLVDLDVTAGSAASRAALPAHVQLDQRGIGAGTVRGDETALASVVDNLLANAGRHARQHVAISVGTDSSGVWLVVDDDGAGVATADRERIFGRFVRLDEARSRDAGGSGLGLALARETASRHGGTLHADDSPLGGARLVLRLPNQS